MLSDLTETLDAMRAIGLPRGGGKTSIDAPTSPIDIEALLARCSGKRSFALSLLTELETTGSQRVAEIARLASNAEFDAVAEAAHSLKGAVAILAAEPLRVLAAAIEAAGHEQAKQQLGELIPQLGHEMKRCLDFIPVFRANPQVRPPAFDLESASR